MPTAKSERVESRKKRMIKTKSFSGQNTHFSSHQSSTKKPDISSKSRPTKGHQKPIKKHKVLNFMTFRGMGCKGNESPVTAYVRPAKKKKKTNKVKESKVVDEVCCAPPGIGFVYDVATPERKIHRECSPTNVSDARQCTRRRGQSHGPRRPEIVFFRHNLAFEGSLNGSDRFVDLRMNIDILSYEELQELSDNMGNAGRGLREDEILSCLKKPKHSILRSLLLFKSRDKDLKCSICQEECKGDDDLGRLDCGHYHHMNCIKHWLLQKNVCPICKTVVTSTK